MMLKITWKVHEMNLHLRCNWDLKLIVFRATSPDLFLIMDSKWLLIYSIPPLIAPQSLMATLWSGQISDVLIYSSSPTYSPTATKGHPMIRPDLRCIDLQYSPTYSPPALMATLWSGQISDVLIYSIPPLIAPRPLKATLWIGQISDVLR